MKRQITSDLSQISDKKEKTEETNISPKNKVDWRQLLGAQKEKLSKEEEIVIGIFI